MNCYCCWYVRVAYLLVRLLRCCDYYCYYHTAGNVPYVIRRRRCLPWWSPSQEPPSVVRAVRVCVLLYLIFIIAVYLDNKITFYPLLPLTLHVFLYSCNATQSLCAGDCIDSKYESQKYRQRWGVNPSPLVLQVSASATRPPWIDNCFNRINSAAVFVYCVWLFQDPVGLNLESDKWQDVNVVVSILKLFFRKLPESLATDG